MQCVLKVLNKFISSKIITHLWPETEVSKLDLADIQYEI